MLDWEWYSDINTSRLFLHLLLIANHEDKKWKGTLVKRGQLITGLHSLSKQTGLSIQEIRTSFTRLKSTNEITINSTNRFSIITLLQWEKYQSKDLEQQAEQQSIQQTINKQSTTNKNVKNEKNIRNIYTLEKLRDGTITKILQEEYTGVDIKLEVSKMINYMEAKGRVYKNYLAFARNWLLTAKATKKGSQAFHLQENNKNWEKLKENEKKYYSSSVRKSDGMTPINFDEARKRLPAFLQTQLKVKDEQSKKKL